MQPVTVIVTAYNYARYVGGAVDSVLAQTWPGIEVLVVDDGSTDETPAVLAAYGDRIRSVRQPNAGLSAARNTGLRLASHPLVSFLDADDELVPHAIERMAAELESAGPSLGVVACQDYPIDESGALIPTLLQPQAPALDISLRDLVVMNRFPVSVVARRDLILEVGGFDAALTSSEDRDLWIRCAARAGIRLLREPLLRRRRHGSNMSANADRQSRNIRAVLRKVRRSGVVPPFDFWFWARVWGVYHFQAALMQHGAGRPWRSLAHLLASSLLRPYLAEHRALRQPPFCRLRAAARSLAAAVHYRPG